MCGEKNDERWDVGGSSGSPPRVRGKGYSFLCLRDMQGITPACAGKSHNGENNGYNDKDHPRVCGEKLSAKSYGRGFAGSPPRVRGKVVATAISVMFIGITPACAGKSSYP